jgi:hypothetical protein
MSRLVGLFLAGCSLLLGACGGGLEQADRPARASTTAPALVVTEQQAPAVPAVLDFTAAGIGGGEIHGARYAGRPVVLWFWSPW